MEKTEKIIPNWSVNGVSAVGIQLQIIDEKYHPSVIFFLEDTEEKIEEGNPIATTLLLDSYFKTHDECIATIYRGLSVMFANVMDYIPVFDAEGNELKSLKLSKVLKKFDAKQKSKIKIY